MDYFKRSFHLKWFRVSKLFTSIPSIRRTSMTETLLLLRNIFICQFRNFLMFAMNSVKWELCESFCNSRPISKWSANGIPVLFESNETKELESIILKATSLFAIPQTINVSNILDGIKTPRRCKTVPISATGYHVICNTVEHVHKLHWKWLWIFVRAHTSLKSSLGSGWIYWYRAIGAFNSVKHQNGQSMSQIIFRKPAKFYDYYVDTHSASNWSKAMEGAREQWNERFMRYVNTNRVQHLYRGCDVTSSYFINVALVFCLNNFIFMA